MKIGARVHRLGHRSARPGGLAGFTLIELVISAGLMSLILVSAYLCLQAAFSSQKIIEPRVEVLQTARIALALMSADLRCACPLSSEADLVGTHRMWGDTEADGIDFATRNYTPRRTREGDFCQVSYFLDKDPRSGHLALWRRRNPRIGPDPFSGGTREQLAKGVAGLRLEYSDGLDWYDDWGDLENKHQFSLRPQANTSGMPEAIRITLLLEPNPGQTTQSGQEPGTNEPPLVFRTVARLNLADAQLAGPAYGSSTNSAAGASNPGQPGGVPAPTQ